MHVTVSIILIFLLIFVNGFFSASEVALLLANEQKLEQDLLNGKTRAKKVLKFKKIPSTFYQLFRLVQLLSDL